MMQHFLSKQVILSVVGCSLFWLPTPAMGQAKSPINIEKEFQKLVDAGAKAKVYKTTEDADGNPVELKLFIFQPENHKATDRRPAIVFFFGGGWRSGKPTQFTRHCQHLAKRGLVAITADYRVLTRQGTLAKACVEDGKSAVRWIRANASELGIDPNRIASGGGSAGGHVAACTGVVKTLDNPTEDKNISSVPNAMVLFNPALVLAPIKGHDNAVDPEKLKTMEARMGVPPTEASPFHNIAAGNPPTIIFHGKADKTVPYWSAEVFEKKMKAQGNRCDLVGYDKQGHGFFNAGRKKGKYNETVAEMDKFLTSLGWLVAETSPTK